MDIVEKYYSELKAAVDTAFSPEEAAVIEKAYQFALASHGEQLRKSGEPYIIHPIAVAKILIGFGMDCQSVVSALLHDVV